MHGTLVRYRLSDVSLAQWLRAAVTLLCVAVAVVDGSAALVVPGACALLVIEFASPPRSPVRLRIASGLLIATLTVALSLHGTAAALPLLLCPAFQAGELVGARGVLVERVAAGASLLLWLWSPVGPATMPGVSSSVAREGYVSVLQWWLLGLALGLLTAWGHRMQPEATEPPHHVAAREAARLSGRLQRVARELPLGLDATAVAQSLLDEVSGLLDADISAVLLKVDDETASPLALRGATRLPWRDPVRSRGALHEAWLSERVTQDVREPDEADGRRRGSAMLCIPIRQDLGAMAGLLVVERRSPEPFSAQDVRAAEHATGWVSPQLQAALHFGELQRSATLFEREQLAREMHDGVAQDLAFVGFGIDALLRSAPEGSPVRRQAETLRTEVSRMLADIRLSIGELRGGVRADQGLGRVLSAQVQHFGATTGTTVQVELRESTVRLPVHVEHALARLAHDLLLDARAGRADTVRVVLDTDPPQVTFLLEHDGRSSWEAESGATAELARIGACVQVIGSPGHDGLSVVVQVGAEAAGASSLEARGRRRDRDRAPAEEVVA